MSLFTDCTVSPALGFVCFPDLDAELFLGVSDGEGSVGGGGEARKELGVSPSGRLTSPVHSLLRQSGQPLK